MIENYCANETENIKIISNLTDPVDEQFEVPEDEKRLAGSVRDEDLLSAFCLINSSFLLATPL